MRSHIVASFVAATSAGHIKPGRSVTSGDLSVGSNPERGPDPFDFLKAVGHQSLEAAVRSHCIPACSRLLAISGTSLPLITPVLRMRCSCRGSAWQRHVC